MPYGAHDTSGGITSVSDHPTDIAFDAVSTNDPELKAFMSDAGNDRACAKFSASNLEMVRVFEDPVDVLFGNILFNFRSYRG